MNNRGSEFSREDLSILPNPSHFFRTGQPIHIYYEVYNLFLSNDAGTTDYRIEYSLVPKEQGGSQIVNFIRNVVLNDEQDYGITTSFAAQGSERDESQFLRIDHAIERPGLYELKLKVTDMTARRSAEKSVLLQIVR